MSSQFLSVDSPPYEYENPTLLLSDTNKLLTSVGISSKAVLSIEELVRVASSMFVAIFETLFVQRIDGIVRSPVSRSDYEHNAQLVVDSLSEQIEMDLQHIQGRLIANGDLRALHNLVHIFLRIVSITAYQDQHSVSSIETDESFLRWRGGDDNKPAEQLGDSFNSKLRQSTASSVYRQALDRLENDHRSDRKVEVARRRRERLLSLRTNRYRTNNLHRSMQTHQTKQRRSLEDDRREQTSHLLRRQSEDQLMLRQVYSQVVDKMKQWRIDEHRESRENNLLLRQQANWHTEVMKSLFSDRLQQLKEHKSAMSDRLTRQQREETSRVSEAALELRRKQIQLLDKERNRLRQSRDHELFRRRESHLLLSTHIGGGGGGAWMDSLRSPCLPSPSRRRSRSAPPC